MIASGRHGPAQLVLLHLAQRAGSEIAEVRSELAALDPVEWRSPTSRLVQGVVQDLRRQLLAAEATIDDGVRLLGSGS